MKPTRREGLTIIDEGLSVESTHPMTPKAEDGCARLLHVMGGDGGLWEIWSTEHWTCVDLIVDTPGTLENGAAFTHMVRRRFAVWQYTGNVYRVDATGAAEDDPFLWVTLW